MNLSNLYIKRTGARATAKHTFLACLVLINAWFASAQTPYLDSLRSKLTTSREDTSKVGLLYLMAAYYSFNQFDSSILYAEQTIALSKKLDYPYGSFLGLRSLFFAYNCQGNYSKALEVTLQNFSLSEKIKKQHPVAFTSVHYFLGVLNREMGNLHLSIAQQKEAIQMHRDDGGQAEAMFPAYCHLALAYQELRRMDSAVWWAQKGYEFSLRESMWSRYRCFASNVLGEIHSTLGHFQIAGNYFLLAIDQCKKTGNYFFLARSYSNLSNLYYKTGLQDSCIYYAKLSLELSLEHKFSAYAQDASSLLTKVYEAKNKPDSSFKYMKIMLAAKDSVYGQSRVKEFQKYVFDEELRKRETANEEKQYSNLIKTYLLIAALVIILLVTTIIVRNISLKRKNEYQLRAIAENELQLQKLESDRTRAELQQQATDLEMQALRAQMHPHFIFNCLSSINRFILINESETASDYLTKFSRLIRMVLNNSKSPLVSLEDELEMLRLYLDLERLRFKKIFEYHIRFAGQIDTTSVFVPSLLLQPFAENAIWHRLMNKEGPGLLDILFKQDEKFLVCSITDNGIGRKKAEMMKSKSAEKRKSMGMQITASRLALFNRSAEKTTISVEDMVDAGGEPAGTRVVLKIKWKESIEEFS